MCRTGSKQSLMSPWALQKIKIWRCLWERNAQIFNDPDRNPWILFFGIGSLMRMEKATPHTVCTQILGGSPCFMGSP